VWVIKAIILLLYHTDIKVFFFNLKKKTLWHVRINIIDLNVGVV
jgi:hypothetical protein